MISERCLEYKMANLSLALITPARNEAERIEETLKAVSCQSLQPVKWIIVSDGSTDGTDEIVSRYCHKYPWILLVRMAEERKRSFASKVECFNAGYRILKEMEYDIIGNLDADITFDEGYFEFLIGKFKEEADLGVAGTPFVENGSHYDYRFTNIEHVSGACQLFRRKCFQEIGGYEPIKGGGIDWVAVTTARLKGWKTRTFTEKVCFHHRKMGTGDSNSIGAWLRHGRKDYFLGGHPIWQIFRSLYQMKSKPRLLGGLLLLIGYTWSWVSRVERPVSNELMAFHRKEQMKRLKEVLGIR